MLSGASVILCCHRVQIFLYYRFLSVAFLLIVSHGISWLTQNKKNKTTCFNPTSILLFLYCLFFLFQLLSYSHMIHAFFAHWHPVETRKRSKFFTHNEKFKRFSRAATLHPNHNLWVLKGVGQRSIVKQKKKKRDILFFGICGLLFLVPFLESVNFDPLWIDFFW